MRIESMKVGELEGAANIDELLAEYAEESKIDGLPPPAAKWEIYRQLGDAMHWFKAVVDDRIIGFISVLASVLPHYSVPVAVSESFFVAKAHRHTGAGVKLLAVTEATAKELGSPGLLVSAPFGGKLFEVLPRLGYVETNRVFFKSFRTNELAVVKDSVPAMTDAAIDKVRLLEGERSTLPQVAIRTEHTFHAGLYARTVYVPAGVLITGALVKLPTLLILQGDVMVYVGADEPLHATGYNVIPAAAGRKQVFVAQSDMALTMIFPTSARTVEEAEAEFTDEVELLQTRRDQPCRA